MINKKQKTDFKPLSYENKPSTSFFIQEIKDGNVLRFGCNGLDFSQINYQEFKKYVKLAIATVIDKKITKKKTMLDKCKKPKK